LSASRPDLLLLAHGERLDGQTNEAVNLMIATLRERNAAAEVGVGFLSASPSIEETVQRLTAPRLLVYPLFMAEGYFLRIAIDRLRKAAMQDGMSRMLDILPTLGVDPALAELVAARAATAASERGFALSETALVLVAHGSLRQAASQAATDLLVERVRRLGRFGGVYGAFLEQPPSLAAALSGHAGPAVLVGLFVGEGMHGQADLQKLIGSLPAELIAFAGTAGSWPDIADLVATRVARALSGSAL
jgi:sirohydrochlorin cobaltochelatase